MKISGSTTIKGGDYNEEIYISGSATVDGNTRCTGLHASGTINANADFECSGRMEISGSGSFKNVKTYILQSSGKFSADSLYVKGKYESSGTGRITGKIKANNAEISGTFITGGNAVFGRVEIGGRFDCEGDAQAENFKIYGPVSVKGLLNAENINIKLGQRTYKNKINSIGGTNIKVEISPLVLFKKKAAVLSVAESIEGDDIYLENTECPLVVGKNVYIGEGCKIGKVQYYNSCRVSDGAEIEKVEKI